MSESASAKWRIQLFGGPIARRGDVRIEKFKSVRIGSLLAYLAMHPGRQDRGILAEEIWGEGSAAQRPASDGNEKKLLSEGISRLREQLGKEERLFLNGNGTVGLNPDLIETDVGRFFAELDLADRTPETKAKAAHLSEALRICREGGELLPGMNHEWVQLARHRIEARRHSAEEDLASLRPLLANGDIAALKEQADKSALAYHRRVALEANRTADTLEQKKWLDTLDRERLSCISAVEWEMQHDGIPYFLGSEDLRRVLNRPGLREEIANWLSRRLKTPGFVHPTPRPWVLSTLAVINFQIEGRKELAIRQMREAAESFRKRGCRPEVAGSYIQLATMHLDMGRTAEWDEYATKALHILVEERIWDDAANVYLNTGKHLIDSDRLDQGLSRAMEAVRLYARLGNPAREMRAFLIAATATAKRRDRAGTDELIRKADGVQPPNLSTELQVEKECTLSVISFQLGDFGEMSRRWARAMKAANSEPWSVEIAGNMLVNAGSAVKAGRPRLPDDERTLTRIATLLSAYRTLAAHYNRPPSAGWAGEIAALEKHLTGRLGARAMESARETGSTLSVPETIALMETLFSS